jgi:NAD+ diphosphatase
LSTAYLFQGNALVLPNAVPDDALLGGMAIDALQKDFGGNFADSFEAPSLDGGGSIAACSLAEDAPLPAGWRLFPVRQFLGLFTQGMVEGAGPLGRMLRAFHIVQWRRESRFCGSCGSPNADADTGELARRCPACGRFEFPRISPAVIVLIINDKDEALLAHNKKFLNNVYSLVAGFNEAGESLEATVAREIREEVNIEVKDIRYAASQPWPFPNSLMLGFTARYASGVPKPDGVEIEDAAWFGRDRLPNLPGPGSVSRYLINRWLEGK